VIDRVSVEKIGELDTSARTVGIVWENRVQKVESQRSISNSEVSGRGVDFFRSVIYGSEVKFRAGDGGADEKGE
jgi:hypothetical protein